MYSYNSDWVCKNKNIRKKKKLLTGSGQMLYLLLKYERIVLF